MVKSDRSCCSCDWIWKSQSGFNLAAAVVQVRLPSKVSDVEILIVARGAKSQPPDKPAIFAIFDLDWALVDFPSEYNSIGILSAMVTGILGEFDHLHSVYPVLPC